jgi:hypothetical protein
MDPRSGVVRAATPENPESSNWSERADESRVLEPVKEA